MAPASCDQQRSRSQTRYVLYLWAIQVAMVRDRGFEICTEPAIGADVIACEGDTSAPSALVCVVDIQVISSLTHSPSTNKQQLASHHKHSNRVCHSEVQDVVVS